MFGVFTINTGVMNWHSAVNTMEDALEDVADARENGGAEAAFVIKLEHFEQAE